MQSSTTVKITIGILITAAAGFILLYYYRKFEEIRSKKRKLSKQAKSSERLTSKTKSRVTTRRISPKHTRKAISSTKMQYSASSELSSDSANHMDLSSKSKKITDRSPSSYVESLQANTSSFSSAGKIRSQYSSKDYPSAIIEKRKELLTSSEKSEVLQDSKIKSSDFVSTTKLLTAKETPSPTEIIPIDSYCYCGQDMAISPDAGGELNENCKVELLPTIVKPVSFDPYTPEDLTQLEGSSDEMSKNSMQRLLKPKNHHIIIPFLPILHAITYAAKHGHLIQELLENYEYFETQFT